MRSCFASCPSSSFLGTAISPFASLSNRSKDWGVSSQFGGALILIFFTYTFFRLPRFWRGSFRPRQFLMIRCLPPFANQFVIGKAFASKRSRRFHKPISISSFAGIKSKSLFVKITEQVKRFYRNVSTFDASLEQRPKVFNPVGVNVAVPVFVRVIDYVMDIFFVKLVVRAKRIAVDRRASFDVLADFAVKHSALGSLNGHCSDFAGAFQQTHYRNLAGVSRAKVLASAHVHIPRLAADIGFINFDVARQLVKRSVLHGLADSMKQKPRALLSHAKGTRQFAGTDAVLRVGDQPDTSQPPIEANRRIFHDGAYLDAELLLARFALPQATGRKIRHFAASADRALNAVRPAKLHQEIRGVFRVSKVNNRLLQSLGEFSLFLHGEAMVQERCW